MNARKLRAILVKDHLYAGEAKAILFHWGRLQGLRVMDPQVPAGEPDADLGDDQGGVKELSCGCA